MTTSPSFEYVRVAIAVMRWAPNYEELIQWWKDEKQHREKWRLTQTQSPGLELKKAFDTKRNELKGT